jgi:hypothetical protein
MSTTTSRLLAFVLSLCVMLACGSAPKPPPPPTVTAASTAPPDPLPSWNDGPVKRSLLDFVARVTRNGPELVPIEERIATFDNDGTLWQEKPVVEGAFVFARVGEMAKADPALREKQPFEAALEHDVATLQQEGKRALLELLFSTHAGMTDDVYKGEVRRFLATARHPRFDRPYTSLTYQPMQELLKLLRLNDFTTYICSGGDVDFMRTFSSSTYGIPSEQVIGSRFEKQLVTVDGRTALLRNAKLESLNDKGTKPDGIDRAIGKRPVFAAGNVRSGGDIEMLRYTRDRAGPSFALVVNHDDDVREFAYAEKDGATLAAARAGGFQVVSMKNDWKVIFSAR